MTQTAIYKKSPERIKLEQAFAVPLLSRKVCGAYIIHTVLSSDGVTKYRVTMDGLKSVGCTCPARVADCKHRTACEHEEAFLVEWNAPLKPAKEACHIAPECDGPPPVKTAEEKAVYLVAVEQERARGVEYFYGYNARIESMMSIPVQPMQEQDDEVVDMEAAQLEELRADVEDDIRTKAFKPKKAVVHQFTTREQRAKAPLNGNRGFQLLA